MITGFEVMKFLHIVFASAGRCGDRVPDGHEADDLTP
jgi:hypothetical protein